MIIVPTEFACLCKCVPTAPSRAELGNKVITDSPPKDFGIEYRKMIEAKTEKMMNIIIIISRSIYFLSFKN